MNCGQLLYIWGQFIQMWLIFIYLREVLYICGNLNIWGSKNGHWRKVSNISDNEVICGLLSLYWVWLLFSHLQSQFLSSLVFQRRRYASSPSMSQSYASWGFRMLNMWIVVYSTCILFNEPICHIHEVVYFNGIK